MCTACNTIPQTAEAASDAFGERLMTTLNEGALSLMLSLGHRTGLFDAMADGEPRTTSRLATDAKLSERYVREWLGAMTCARVVEHDREARTYRLPPEHAAWLTRAAGSNNLANTMQFFAVSAAVETKLVQAFKDGKGVPYAAYERFGEVMADESTQTVVAALDEHILPLIPGIVERLENGIDVLDVGCGRGRALIHLARRFPKSRFTGCDFLSSDLENARAEATRHAVQNAHFEAKDAATISDNAAFDFITTFDAVHDQADPAAVLANIRRALRPGGVYLCQEIKAETEHADNLDHPLGTFTYTISCMHCMSVSLAQGGLGLGAVWGRTLCRTMLGEAGFTQIERHELEHDIINDFYVCRT